MGDLERMGRELKCPICLSLLHSAASLTCNHLFCNSCILKSMKSASSCPVCKIPFTRREVRPSPHIDNLVAIYKNMEAASGTNLFLTQNPSDAKSPDEEKQCEGNAESAEKGSGGTQENHAEEEKTPVRKKLTKKLKSGKKSLSVSRSNPSFPAKKRVQVPQDILSETPLRGLKLRCSQSRINKEGTQEASTKGKEMEIQSEKRDHVKEPFFWLREEQEGERLSGRTDEDQIIEGSTPVPPSFSDLKDADDESPTKQAPSDEVQNKSSVNLFDSEMFEWTQKPCSPELFSTPTKMQVEDAVEIDEELVPATQEHQSSADVYSTQFANPNGNQLANKSPSGMSSQIRSSGDLNGKKKSPKRSRKAREKYRQDHIKELNRQSNVMNMDSNIASKAIEEQSLDPKNKASNLKMSSGRAKKVCFVTSADSTSQNACTVSNILGVHNNDERKMTKNSHASASKQDSELLCPKKIAGKSQVKRPGKQRLDVVRDPCEDLNSVQNQRKELAGSASSSLSPQMDNDRNTAITRKRKSSLSKKSTPCSTERKSTKKPKPSPELISRDKNDKERKPDKSIKKVTDVRVLNDSLKEKQCHLTDQSVLRTCVNHAKKYQCAFCLSSEESEASGAIVHYFDGKPVTADYEGGSKVIHCHRNCTEWAPNVYFEDDNAKNLEAEISRSRRIKCSFCGLKGAALGCYEKSCRRSFHVPCAKWTPECRWDMENFVLLCPLHAASMLPSESSGSHHRSKTLAATKAKSCSLKHDATRQSWIARGSHKKIVLCCSALSLQERDVVSEFERLFKVTVSKTWDSSVTHVIASTDENGACRRTLKVLMGILEGKWILSIEWIKACIRDAGPVDEDHYEVNVDIHGIKDGPCLGRLRVLNKQPKLFDGYMFYFVGDFVPSYKGYLQDLVIAAGGIILHRKPVSDDQNAMPHHIRPHQTLIIYNLELPANCNPLENDAVFSQRQRDAEVLARSTGSMVASNTWILNSIAGCRLQSVA